MTYASTKCSVDSRFQLLKQWLDSELGANQYNLTKASDDASFRRYFRVTFANAQDNKLNNQTSIIAMDAPPEHESLSPFVEIAKDWLELEIETPQILSINRQYGFILLEDFGQVTMLKEVEESDSTTVKEVYQLALSQLISLQKATKTSPLNNRFKLPGYARELLKKECELFREWFLGVHCDFDLSLNASRYLDDLFSELIEIALAQPKVVVHRDYHSRNLMFRPHIPLGIIDFQDAVYGPLFYDSVSLLKDCYHKLPKKMAQELFKEYCDKVTAAGLLSEETAVTQFWYDFMGVQRHLKAIGIFCRLHYRDGKSHYLQDIPCTAAYIMDLYPAYPQLKELNEILQEALAQHF